MYKRLPVDIKNQIEARFEINKYNNEDKLPAIRMILEKVENDVKEKDEPGEITIEEMDVKQLLLIHNRTFDSWRYLHEFTEDGYILSCNFRLMHAFVNSIREVMLPFRK